MPTLKPALLMLLISLLCACGQTGPLVLPDAAPDDAGSQPANNE